MGSLAEISKCPNSVHLSRDSLIGQRPRNARCGCLSLRAGPRNWPSLSFSGSSCAQFANDAVPSFVGEIVFVKMSLFALYFSLIKLTKLVRSISQC